MHLLALIIYHWTFSCCDVSAIKVTGLYRYAVKGLSGDPLPSVHFGAAGETFPDDRRFALLYETNEDNFNGKDWSHKENFLCAFTDPTLMASMRTKYDSVEQQDGTVARRLEIRNHVSSEVLLESVNLATEQGRQELAAFMSKRSGKKVVCVTADADQEAKHTFQFGNTSSGYKNNAGNTRTVHIVNKQTVDAVSEAIGILLNPLRFRPNIVVDGVAPFEEFEWVEQGLSLSTAALEGRLRALSRTVRCRGIALDSSDQKYGWTEINLPEVLAKHFPEHGPYLGIYVCLDDAPMTIALGDELVVLPSTSTVAL